jgi:bacteriocin biosynthesis cyclodehydratase domain-containing protein
MNQRTYHRPVLRTTADRLIAPTAATPESSPEPTLLKALADRLTGAQTLDAVIGDLVAAGFEIEAIVEALAYLDGHDLLEEAASSELRLLGPEEIARYEPQMRLLAALDGHEQTGVSTPLPVRGLDAQSRLRQALVVILGGGLNGGALTQALLLAGVGRLLVLPLGEPPDVAGPYRLDNLAANMPDRLLILREAGDLPTALEHTPARLLLYCPDRFDPTAAEWLNAIGLETGVPFLPFRRQGLAIDVGPLVIPHETACYRCFQLRCAAAGAISGQEDPGSEAEPCHPTFPLGVDWLALEAIKYLGGVGEPVTYGRLWRFNLGRGLASVHPVLKLPRCPACGVHRRRPALRLWEEWT